MRTTIELDNTLFREIDILASTEGKSLKHVINNLLRIGIRASQTPSSNLKLDDMPVFKAKPKKNLSVNNIWDLIDSIEGI